MEHQEEKGKGRGRGVVKLIVLIVAAVAIGVAIVVVVRNAGRITTPEPQVTMDPVQADTGVVRRPRVLKRRVERLERRYKKCLDQAVGFTPEQDSLVRICDSGFVDVWAECAVLDTLTGSKARLARFRAVRQQYDGLKKPVYRFTRLCRQAVPEPELDSLDQELLKLLSE